MNDRDFTTMRLRRPSFTLVELLTAIAILGIMSGMVLVVLAGAQRDAYVARTRGTIQKLHEIVLQRWEEYRYRAPKINLPPEWLLPQAALGGQVALSPREGSRLRMIVLRDLMRMEMPDRMSDIEFPPTIYKVAGFTYDNPPPSLNTGNDTPYTLTRTVPGQYNNLRQRAGLGSLPSPYTGPVVSVVPSGYSGSINSAEWLYYIVAASNFQGGSALEYFRPSEVGDVDDDNHPEFIDAWGNPIWWIRWPSSFDSPYNAYGAADAMDPLHTDWRWMDAAFENKPWTLVPLIISSGPDGVFDIKFEGASSPIIYATQRWVRATDSPAHSAGPIPYYFPDPFVDAYANNGQLVKTGLGSVLDQDGDGTTDGAADNIHNHNLTE